MPTDKLPNRSPDRMWGSFGDGAECTICAESVTRDDIEYEIQFARDGEPASPEAYRVHARCFLAWDSDRRTQPAA